MDPRLLRIRSSLRADAALAVVEAIHIGNLSSFEVDAYIECNIRADAYEIIYCECLVLKMAAYPEVDTFAPAACAGRIALIALATIATQTHSRLCEAEDRLFVLTRNMNDVEFRQLSLDAIRHRAGL